MTFFCIFWSKPALWLQIAKRCLTFSKKPEIIGLDQGTVQCENQANALGLTSVEVWPTAETPAKHLATRSEYPAPKARSNARTR
jgi:hypothetical protein